MFMEWQFNVSNQRSSIWTAEKKGLLMLPWNQILPSSFEMYQNPFPQSYFLIRNKGMKAIEQLLGEKMYHEQHFQNQYVGPLYTV